jgi:TP901 family phage tail tape measure protein
MANETKIGIDVQASTAAAKAALGDLGAETRRFVEAGDAAGKSQKKLGQEVGEARARQLEATEAIRRAKAAQQEHTLTVAAFGKGSAQAKASQQALTAAQVEARKAADAAAKALENTAKRATEVAKAEGDQLSPATQRLAKQLKDMGADADRSAAELRKLDLAAVTASKGAGQLGKGLTALQVAAGSLLAGGVSRAITGIGDALSGSVGKAVDFQKSFAGITKVLDDKSAENIARVDAGVKTLATDLGVLPTEVAAMTAALAASGLQDDLQGYTEDSAKLGVAFDLTGQQAGHAIASLTASLGLSRGEMQSLMGTINELDDGMNSSSKQLVEYLEATAGIGRAASVSGETMLGLGSAIISTGVSADVAATGVKGFLATMESGAAATDKQQAAFERLGFSAVEVAKQMASGNAEAQIKAMVAAIGKLPNEDRFGVLIDLFGRESIGAVGGLATNVNLLGQSFEIAGDKMAAAGSVQAEFERVSQTSANRIEKLKANVEVLAISFGDRLLPYIDEVTAFLTSPEGKEWGAAAVEKAVKVVTTLADGVGWLVGKFSAFADAAGGAGVAIAALGAAAVALTGPFGAAAAAGAAIGFGMAEAYDSAARAILGDTAKIGAKMQALLNTAADIRHKEHVEEMAMAKAELDADQQAMDQHMANRAKAEALAQRYEAAELARLGKRATEEQKLEAFRKARQLASAVEGNSRLLGGGTEEDRLKNFEKYVEDKEPDAPREKSSKEKKAAAKAGAAAARKQAAKDKHDNAFARDLMEFDADVANHAAQISKKLREDDIAAQEAAYEREIRLNEGKLQRIDQEIELLEARGIAERESVDAVFFTIEIESEAEQARQAMLDDRLRREMKFARWQLQNARTEKQREEAQTRVELTEHRKRLAAAEKAHAAEVAEQSRRVKMFERVTGHITGLGDALVTAVWAQAEGEKGAVAASVAAYAKGVSQKMALKALEETALGVAALAGIVTAGLAPAHFAAAGLAAMAAAAAGGAAYGLGKVAVSQGYEGQVPGQKKREKPDGTADNGAKPRSGGGGGGGDDDGVPTSYVEAANYQKRNMPTSREPVGGQVIQYNFPGMQVLGGTQEQVGIAMERLIRKAGQSAGKTR